MQDNLSFGPYLKACRKARDLTQEQLAEKAGCAVETIRKAEAERNRLSGDLAQHLAEVLEIPKHEQEVFVRLARQVRKDPMPSLYEAGQQVWENPYKWLDAFEEEDARNFFGRTELIARLVTRLREMDQRARFLAVVGASGSGKSSVVQAGLIPALRQGAVPGSKHWNVQLLDHPVPVEKLVARLQTRDVRALVRQMGGDDSQLTAWQHPADEIKPEHVLIIDHFEQIFTRGVNESARVQVLDALCAAATEPSRRLIIIIVLRADFSGYPLQHPQLSRLFQHRVEFVPSLTPEELHEAIVGPAKHVGVEVEPALVAAMIHDVGTQPGALPLLQYALAELFVHQRQRGQVLTLDAYRAQGRVSRVLNNRATEVYKSLSPQQQRIAQQLFLRLVTLGEGVEDTRRRVHLTELTHTLDSDNTVAAATAAGAQADDTDPKDAVTDERDDLDEVLERFEDARLLTRDHDPQTHAPTVEIAHEALISAWKPLHDWLNTSRDALRVQHQLLAAATEWVRAGQDPSFLVGGTRLAQFEDLAASGVVTLNNEERAYLTASLTERERQTMAERERQERERAQLRALAQEQQQRAEAERQRAEEQQQRAEAERQRAEEQQQAAQRSRRQTQLLAGAFVLVLATAVFAGWFWYQSEVRAQLNLAQLLVSEGRRMAEQGEPLLGLRLVLEGFVRTPVGSNDRNIIAQTVRDLSSQGRLRDLGTNVRATYSSKNGEYFAITHDQGANEVWRVVDNTRILTFTGEVNYIEFSQDPGATYLAVNYVGRPAELRHAATGKLKYPLNGHRIWLSPDPGAMYFVLEYIDQPAELRLTATGEVIQQLSDYLDHVWFSADPAATYFVVSYDGQPAELRLTATGEVIQQLNVHHVNNVWFSADPAATYLVVDYTDQPAELRLTATGGVIQQLSQEVFDIQFSQDPAATYLAVTYMSGPDELRRAATGEVTQQGNGIWLSADPAATYFVVSYNDGSGEVRLTATGEVTQQFSSSDTIYHVWFSPDPAATYFVVNYLLGRQPDEIRLTATGEVAAELSSQVERVWFSSDPAANMLLVQYNDRPSEVWTWSSPPRRLAMLDGILEEGRLLDAIAFAATNQHLAVHYVGGRAEMLDFTWLQAMDGRVDQLSEQDLLTLACDMRRAGRVDVQSLAPYLGNQQPQACLDPSR